MALMVQKPADIVAAAKLIFCIVDGKSIRFASVNAKMD